MIVRIFVGVGLFALGYFVGKEMGRAEYIRDQLRWADEDGELMQTRRDSPVDFESASAGPAALDEAWLAQERS